jgi:carboxymethylenebutenolidase
MPQAQSVSFQSGDTRLKGYLTGPEGEGPHPGVVIIHEASDLKAALSFLESRPGVDSARVGAIGFCMGGGLAIAWACTDNRLSAIAPYYASNPRPLEAVARACPLVGSYPGSDFTASMARKLDAALDEYSVPHDIKIYPGAKHSFFNDQGRSYDAVASEDSWRRTLAFFKERLA